MTLEEKIRLIAQEFSGKETTPKTDEKLQRLEQRRITPNSLIPKRRFLFEMFDKPCFARGELVGITGRAKSGKTFFTSMLIRLKSISNNNEKQKNAEKVKIYKIFVK